MYDKSKFKFSETFNNRDGKTSGSGFIGVILGLIGGFVILAGVFAYFFHYAEVLEFMSVGIKTVAISAGLMGTRKIVGQIWKDDPEAIEPEKVPGGPQAILLKDSGEDEKG